MIARLDLSHLADIEEYTDQLTKFASLHVHQLDEEANQTVDILLRMISGEESNDFHGHKDFLKAVLGDADGQCGYCFKYLKESRKQRHGLGQCANKNISSYSFPGSDKFKFCLVCFARFPLRHNAELVLHYGTQHGKEMMKLLGYSPRLLDLA